MLGERRQKCIQRAESKPHKDAALQTSSWTLRWTVPNCRSHSSSTQAGQHKEGTLWAHRMCSDIPSTSTAHTPTHTAQEFYFLIPIPPASKAIRNPPRTEKIGLGLLRFLLYLTEIKIKETTLLS